MKENFRISGTVASLVSFLLILIALFVNSSALIMSIIICSIVTSILCFKEKNKVGFFLWLTISLIWIANLFIHFIL